VLSAGELEDHGPGLRRLERYAIDDRLPAEVLRPASTDELADILRKSSRDGLGVVPWGGGTHQGIGNGLARYDVAIDLSALDAIQDHQPADLTLTVQAGATLLSVQQALAQHGQFLPLAAEDPARATIGGLLSARVAGPTRLRYGTPRDLTLWLEAYGADGQAVHGGAKVVKNVAGYDLPKLYIGALGTLGLITSLCFKVYPLPVSAPTVLAGFSEPGAASELLATLATGRLEPSLVTLVKGPARWGEPYGFAPWTVAIGADGPSAATSWQIERFFGLAVEAGALAVTALVDEDSAIARQALMSPRLEGAVRLAAMVLPGRLALLLETIAFLSSAAPLGVFAEATLGVVRVSWEQPTEAWLEVAKVVEDLGGRWVLEGCPAAWKQAGLDVWGPSGADRPLMRRLKAALDPRGLFAPGRFVGG
jgi:glycolate oxidase FAD binding subunit